MPNAQFTPGPILHYVAFPQIQGSSGYAYYLGTHVTAPHSRAEYPEIPVYNDLGGRSVRFQSIADGEEWKLSTTLNRFDYQVVRLIRYLKSGVAITGAFPTPANTFSPVALGTHNFASRGTLVMGLQDFNLILVNSYATTAAAGLPLATALLDLNTARGFASCSMTAYEETTESTRVLEVSMAMEARGIFNPTLAAATVNNLPSVPSRGFGTYFEGGIPSTLTLAPVN
jgi:hypothetical protein